MAQPTSRKAVFTKPKHWNDAPPPNPAPAGETTDPDGLPPTRYGDWVKNGIAVDF